ncbi:MAG: hypothetical protein ACYSUX_04845 [Planctomycetota bacterium]|jgi:hypothetical protein
MVLLAGILAGGLCIWFAVRIGFYETWAMLFNIVISIYLALFLARPIVNFLPEGTSNIPCRDAITLAILAVGSFLILHNLPYTLWRIRRYRRRFRQVQPLRFILAVRRDSFGGILAGQRYNNGNDYRANPKQITAGYSGQQYSTARTGQADKAQRHLNINSLKIRPLCRFIFFSVKNAKYEKMFCISRKILLAYYCYVEIERSQYTCRQSTGIERRVSTWKELSF